MFFRRILVPVDFSPRSRTTLAYAAALVRAVGGEIDLLHVVHGPGYARAAIDAYLGRPMPHASASDIVLAREDVQALLAEVDLHGIVPRILIASGDPAAVIVQTAVELPSDLIIIGTRGHRGVAEVLLGSVTHKVITTAPGPVVTLADRLALPTPAS